MNGAKFIERKNETARIILSLQDEALLNRIYAILHEEEEPTPEHVLDILDQRISDAKSGTSGGTPLDDYLLEIESL